MKQIEGRYVGDAQVPAVVASILRVYRQFGKAGARIEFA